MSQLGERDCDQCGARLAAIGWALAMPDVRRVALDTRATSLHRDRLRFGLHHLPGNGRPPEAKPRQAHHGARETAVQRGDVLTGLLSPGLLRKAIQQWV